jgi:hypothetical protein
VFSLPFYVQNLTGESNLLIQKRGLCLRCRPEWLIKDSFLELNNLWTCTALRALTDGKYERNSSCVRSVLQLVTFDVAIVEAFVLMHCFDLQPLASRPRRSSAMKVQAAKLPILVSVTFLRRKEMKQPIVARSTGYIYMRTEPSLRKARQWP